VLAAVAMAPAAVWPALGAPPVDVATYRSGWQWIKCDHWQILKHLALYWQSWRYYATWVGGPLTGKGGAWLLWITERRYSHLIQPVTDKISWGQTRRI